ncbi:MAG: GntR family transcriptional regulator [Solirubrobacterales bacterium]
MTNANDAAANIIRRAIIRGELLPGERLKEAEIARELGISRTPVREAMLVLQAEGLLDLAPSRGATVRPYDLDELLLLYDLRQLLEGYAARYAATRITPEQLRELEESCERMESLDFGDIVAHNEENIFFHSHVLDIVGSDRLRHIVKSLLEIPLPYKRGYWSDEENKDRSIGYHRRIVAALRAGDPGGAEQAMRDHLEDSGRRTVEAFEAVAEAEAAEGATAKA